MSRGNNAMRAAEAIEVKEHDVVATEIWEDESASADSDPGAASFGQRLGAARERQGWSRAEVAARLKLPANLIARLEGDQYDGLTQGVFLRGYLASYARLVGVPVEEAADIAAAHTQAAPLVATGTISRSRYLFDRYSVSATYLVLTAIIVVPAVWLATHGGLEQNLARTTPLDPPPAIQAPAGDAASALAPEGGIASAEEGYASPSETTSPAPLLAQPEPAAVIASMTPFASARSAPPTPPASATPNPETAVAIGSGAHSLTLKLQQQSWVEITAADGRKLEYGMLAAGSEHTYRSDGAMSVRLGNVQGAQVITEAGVVDLAPFQRGNVAHLKLFGADGASPNRVEQ